MKAGYRGGEGRWEGAVGCGEEPVDYAGANFLTSEA